MPVNKSALFRFEIIDECLRNTNKKWTKADLLHFVNRRLTLHYGGGKEISISQIRYDLIDMQTEFSAPIEMYRIGNKCYYKYDEPNYSIKTIPVAEADLEKLHAAIEILEQLNGFTLIGDILEVISKIEHKYNYQPKSNRCLLFDTYNQVSWLEHLEDIYQSIMRQTVLKITHNIPQSSYQKTEIIHPYFLKEYRHRWYLLGYSTENNTIQTIALDSMVDIRVSNSAYIKNSFADPTNYFRNIIGVSKPTGKPISEIHLIFTPNYAPNILGNPIHHSQKLIEQFSDGSVHIQLSLIINTELISLLLSYGSEMTVLSPDELSLKIRSAAQTLLNNYGT